MSLNLIFTESPKGYLRKGKKKRGKKGEIPHQKGLPKNKFLSIQKNKTETQINVIIFPNIVKRNSRFMVM